MVTRKKKPVTSQEEAKPELVEATPIEATPEKPEESKEVAVSMVNTVEGDSDAVARAIKETEKKVELLSQFIKGQLKEGVDYGKIAFHAKNCPNKFDPKVDTAKGCTIPYCRYSKPFLQKPGSEKFAILFGHRPHFIWIKQDFETGIFAVKCLILNGKNPDNIIGEGYGSARVSEKEKWTENEAMKIACKRAQIDASLRAYGLSEHFTQDLDDMQSRKVTPAVTTPAPTAYPPRPTYYSPAPVASRPVAGSYPARPTYSAPAPAGNFEPRNPDAPISDGQMRMLFGIIRRLNKDKAWLESWIFQTSGIEKVEQLTMGWASKFINGLNKKVAMLEQSGDLPTIRYDEEREVDASAEPRDVEVPEDGMPNDYPTNDPTI